MRMPGKALVIGEMHDVHRGVSYDASNTKGHGQTLDFTLTSGSPAIGFGDPARQPADGLGTIDASGFLRASTVARTADRHNAGAYP